MATCWVALGQSQLHCNLLHKVVVGNVAAHKRCELVGVLIERKDGVQMMQKKKYVNVSCRTEALFPHGMKIAQQLTARIKISEAKKLLKVIKSGRMNYELQGVAREEQLG